MPVANQAMSLPEFHRKITAGSLPHTMAYTVNDAEVGIEFITLKLSILIARLGIYKQDQLSILNWWENSLISQGP